MAINLIIIIIFILFPILSLPILFLMYLLDKKKNSLFYSSLIGIVLGIICYYYVPYPTYDLVRHQYHVTFLIGKTIKSFFKYIEIADLEFIPLLYSYMISFTKNVDLLQFFVVALGYTLILYILYDYRKIKKINTFSFLIVVIFTLFGFNTLYFISGLYCYIAMILFSIAIYNEYIKKKYKFMSYIIYVLVLLIHNSMFLPVLLLIMYKMQKNKFNFITFIGVILVFIFSLDIINLANKIFPNVLFEKILHMFNSYTSNNEYLKNFYDGIIFFIEISKLIIVLICSFLSNKKNNNQNLIGYIFLLSLSTILMMFKSIVAIRYIMIIQFIGIVPIINVLKEYKNKIKILIKFLILNLGLIYMAYFIKKFYYQNFEIQNKFYYNIFNIFNK